MDKNTETGFGPRAGLREWIGMAVLALPTLLLALDASVLFLALAHLGADLGPGSSQLLWITGIYGFMIAGFLITMGTLGDRIGRRRLLVIGSVPPRRRRTVHLGGEGGDTLGSWPGCIARSRAHG